MVKYLYNLVMDPERNPLQVLPKMVRFQYMVILACYVVDLYPDDRCTGSIDRSAHDPADRRVLHRRHLPRAPAIAR